MRLAAPQTPAIIAEIDTAPTSRPPLAAADPLRRLERETLDEPHTREPLDTILAAMRNGHVVLIRPAQ
jgi:hypothetical protein